jgi:hypothetical protein
MTHIITNGIEYAVKVIDDKKDAGSIESVSNAFHTGKQFNDMRKALEFAYSLSARVQFGFYSWL